mmetsp:Transcript_27336/g.49299  ORF Transcript_27336/g.49299 Transcript_27336/m.49299 type:complete len:266 (+) Transcript_27336:162-959(+)|eukprot:CAMPEP_0201904764 /NCGR_PEP_ID=MMETSP0902-20130614/56164_1 /ASSEMBLY_ACC=CAM_ASM_000551 /TAXON_ID=420261 /ORGANISM="Thalassiosira antarctica, Strain CCMP982" /LENGTH=265 /DNA_ID=CAMNT_0048438859 /DNA_START=433 /DNA_END=1230 /DNA_ORIENTATION=-
MASSQSYFDFEQDYNTHLSQVRSFLAQPTNNNSPNYATNISSCEQALQSAKQCIHAMRGLAEIEGDPFKAEEAKRKLERDIGPLEEEIRGRRVVNGGGGGISSVFNRSNNGGGGGGRTTMSNAESYLFRNRTTHAYAPPSMTEDDLEMGEGSLAPLTAMEQRMQDSEHLLRETQALCADSEQVGASTLETMGRQREQMERSDGLIHQSIENTQQARMIMKEMARRALKNKIFLYCVIALLVLANGSMVVHLWRRRNNNGDLVMVK